MKKGFTLVEMAVVLILIGIISGFGTLKIVQGMTQTRVDMENRDMLKNLSGAVAQFAASSTNNVLPTLAEFKVIAEQYTNDNKTVNQYRQRRQLAFSGVNTGICSTSSTPRTVKVCRNTDCSDYYEVKDVAFSIVADAAKVQVAGDTITIPWGGGNQEAFIKYITIAELRLQTSCLDDFRIVTETLPPIDSTGKNFSTIAIGAENGVPRDDNGMYYWCIVDNNTPPIFSAPGPANRRILYTSYGSPSITTDVQRDVKSCENSLKSDNYSGRYLGLSALIVPVSDPNSDLAGGNYPITVVAKDRNVQIATKELIVTVTNEQIHKPDMINNPDMSIVNYGCFSLKKNDNSTITICNKTPTAPTKNYCAVTGFITGTTIGNATDCRAKIEDFLK